MDDRPNPDDFGEMDRITSRTNLDTGLTHHTVHDKEENRFSWDEIETEEHGREIINPHANDGSDW